ncbi:hypothetical protein N7532_011577, partial [Penicillium argentinense]
MGLKKRILFSLLVGIAQVSVAGSIDYFEDASVCADPNGLAKCYDGENTRYVECINESCPNSLTCLAACDGDERCISQKCPSDDADCIYNCACKRAGHEISCLASSCWNQIYSCEYQKAANDLIQLCEKPHLDDIPFWPPPDNAPGGCSCNIAKIFKQQIQVSDQLTKCGNNKTNIDKIGDDVNDSIDYSRACICCAESAMMSKIYDTCPNTEPSIIGADNWFGKFFEQNQWAQCGEYLDKHDCAGDLGYGAKDAGDTHRFYKPGQFPQSGAETLSNTKGIISTPIGREATFTWTYGSDVYTVTATTGPVTETISSSSASATATETRTETSRNETLSTAASTAATSTQTGIGNP